MAGVVIGLDQTARFLQDEVFFFHHAVRWQPALAFAHTHAATGGRKTHANLVGRFNAVVQTDAVGVDVEVVAAGGATAEQQLGHGNLVGHQHHLGRQPCPGGVEPLQPGKQFGILYTGNGPRQALHHVVVRVDHARNHDVLAGIHHLVHSARGQPGVERLVLESQRS